jgi:hypothetical protein
MLYLLDHPLLNGRDRTLVRFSLSGFVFAPVPGQPEPPKTLYARFSEIIHACNEANVTEAMHHFHEPERAIMIQLYTQVFGRNLPATQANAP